MLGGMAKNLRDFRELLETLLTASGVECLKFDGHVFLRVQDADEYELRVRRADDDGEHYLPIRFRARPLAGLADRPLLELDAHRLAARARRWLRLPPPPMEAAISPEMVELFTAEMAAAAKAWERDWDALLWGPRHG